MLLYHGTSEKNMRAIMSGGLKPRSRRKGNWKHTVDSNPNAIYLTTVYAGYFAFCATQKPEKDKWLIIEVDTDKLDEKLLHPDEDVLAQMSHREYVKMGVSLNALTEIYRDKIADYQHLWKTSLEAMGTCAYNGIIPPESFSRVVVYDPATNPQLTLSAMDPAICIMNYKFMQGKYEDITRALMGEKVEFENSMEHMIELMQKQLVTK